MLWTDNCVTAITAFLFASSTNRMPRY
jgi:hypothetical protein